MMARALAGVALLGAPVVAPAQEPAAPDPADQDPVVGEAAVDTSWPGFRGHRARGIAAGAAAPTRWDVEQGTNVLWRTSIPGLAHSSPVVWGERLFVTTAVRAAGDAKLSSLYGSAGYGSGDPVEDEGEHDFRLLCLDKRSGEILWERSAHRGVPRVKRHPKSTHANSTPACDAERVVAFFASEGLHCYDHEGELLWRKDLGLLDTGAPRMRRYQWGFASSPVLHEGRVILQCDVQDQSFLAVLDAKDGEEIWRTERDEDPTWSTPTVIDRGADGRPQIVVNGYKHIGGYDLESGEEVWKLVGGGDVPVPTPVFADESIFITSAHGRLRPIYAVRADARGSVTMEAAPGGPMRWSHARKGIYMQTPIVVGGRLYCCNDSGVLGCYDAATGAELFRERLGSGGAGFSASAVAVGGLLYFTAEDGEVFVVQPGAEFEVLAVNSLGETCLATPAVSEGVLYFRTRGHLLAVAQKTDAGGQAEDGSRGSDGGAR